MRLIIKKLFNKQDYDLCFDNKLNVIIGENGCGKTTVLRIMNLLINKRFIELNEYDFESIEISEGNVSFVLNKKDIEQLEISKNYDFRPLIFETSVCNFESFDEFYNYVLEKANSFYDYPSQTNNTYDYIIDKESYLNDDNLYVKNNEFYSFMASKNVVFGSKYYLFYLYSFFKGVEASFDFEKIANKSDFYTFIDIKESNEMILDTMNDKHFSLIQKYLKDKKIEKRNDSFIIIDKSTNEVIDYMQLSSGERKMIKLINVLVNANNHSFLMLDEPELSLSIFWQRMFIEDLLNVCEAKKIFIATQSTNFLEEDEIDMLIPMFVDNDEDFDE